MRVIIALKKKRTRAFLIVRFLKPQSLDGHLDKKDKKAQTLGHALAVVKKACRTKNFLDTDDGRKFGNKTFASLLKSLNITVGSLYTSKGFVFPERLIWTIGHLLKKETVRTR